MRETLVELCYSHPHLYKLCDKVSCVPYQQKCPCKADSEFQCSEAKCIDINLRCDGIQHCKNGEDEKLCHLLENTTEVTEIQKLVVTESYRPEQSTSVEELSIPVMVTVISFSVFILVLLLILLCFYITSGPTKHTHKESHSAITEEAHQESYLTTHLEDSDSSDQSSETARLRAYPSTGTRRLNYSQVNRYNFDSDVHVNIRETNEDDDDIFAMENHSSADNENVYTGGNMAINPDVEIYNTCVNGECRADGLGKYAFRPTLDYMKNNSYHDIDDEDSYKLFVRNSYKQRHGQNSVRTSLSNDRGKFLFKFTSGLLCSSTPSHSLKQSVSYSDVSDV